MSNFYYELYQNFCAELQEMMEQHQGSMENAKKLKGAVASELLRREIARYLSDNKEPFKPSAVNSYIAGSTHEYDLLLVKESAEPYLGLIYQPEDVIAVIECKAGGIYKIDTDTDQIATAVNRAIETNPEIQFGYITITENVPVHDTYRGKPTVKHWNMTGEKLREKINGDPIVYAVTLHKGKELCDEGSDDEFYDFVRALIGKPAS